jgi:hypothetical protein
MAKANTGKVIQMLSPENYIRKKVRTLPLYECLVNFKWERSKMASIVVERQHTNGNVTACIYLVDLMCLGVKDTSYMFNVPLFEYKEKIEETLDKMNLDQISYELAHNIVYAGLEYAEEYGFSPHKDFTPITCHMLEEDNDDIELLDIECGHRGKPAYMRAPFDSKSDVKKNIDRRTKTAGPGNFIILESAGAEDMEDFYDFDDDDLDDTDDLEEYYDEFSGKADEEKQELFMQLFGKLDSLAPDEITHFKHLADSIFYDLCDPGLIDEYLAWYRGELEIDVLTDDEIPDEVPCIIPGTIANLSLIKKQFIDTYNTLNKSTENAREEWKTFHSVGMGIPGVYFLELMILQFEEAAECKEKLEKYYSRHNDYMMIRLLWLIEQVNSENFTDENLLQVIRKESFFPGRHSLHNIELHYFLIYSIDTASVKKDPSRLEALSQTLDDFDCLSDKDRMAIIRIISFFKVKTVINHIEKIK